MGRFPDLCVLPKVVYLSRLLITVSIFFLILSIIFQEKVVVRKTCTDPVANTQAHRSETLKGAFEIWLHFSRQVIVRDGCPHRPWIAGCFHCHHAILQAAPIHPETQSIPNQNQID